MLMFYTSSALDRCSVMYPTIYYLSCPFEHPGSSWNFTHPKLSTTFVPTPPTPCSCPSLARPSQWLSIHTRVSGCNLGLIPATSPGLPPPVSHEFLPFWLENVTQTLSPVLPCTSLAWITATTSNFVPSCPNPFTTQKPEQYLENVNHIASLPTPFFLNFRFARTCIEYTGRSHPSPSFS